jgi:hypothetical protein
MYIAILRLVTTIYPIGRRRVQVVPMRISGPVVALPRFSQLIISEHIHRSFTDTVQPIGSKQRKKYHDMHRGLPDAHSKSTHRLLVKAYLVRLHFFFIYVLAQCTRFRALQCP